MVNMTGIRIGRVDFSDPQGRKGACDRKAASIKAHVRRYINEGQDVQTANDFKEAMMSSGGMKGVRIALVDASTLALTSSEIQGKWEGVSSQNNFCYSDRGITTWRAYGIGTGKLVRKGGVQMQGKPSVCCYITIIR